MHMSQPQYNHNMKPDEDILDDIIKDGSVETDVWPDLLKRLLERLDTVAHTAFPTVPTLSAPAAIIAPDVSESQVTVPDNPPLSRETSTHTAATGPPASPLAEVSESQLLHPDDAAALKSIAQTMSSTFPTAPPHTVQRFAELLRSPRAHYTSLPKYLRALERVVSVSSTSSAFPLPRNPTEAETLANGTNNGHTFAALGSDESLGGALLTPISWLTPGTEDENGEQTNGIGVSQGELLRQEQELNIVPAAQVGASGAAERGEGRGEEGPPNIGAEDVGPQPEGTVFPDPPRSPEDIGSPPVTSSASISEAVAVDTRSESETEDKKDEEMPDAEAAVVTEVKTDDEQKEDEKEVKKPENIAAGGEAMQVDEKEKK